MTRPVAVLVRDYQWIHLGLGMAGNLAFLVGSVFFLWESWQVTGTWLFILGAAGMLIESVGSAFVKLAQEMSPELRREVKNEYG